MRESPIFLKMFDLVAWIVPMTVKFPREQRFVLAANLQRVVFAAHEALIHAGHTQDATERAGYLREVLVQLALARFYVRMSERLGYMSHQQYEYASGALAEVGKLTHGWRKAAPKQTVPELAQT